MSNEYTAFRNIDGETAFLAGAVDALCGVYLGKMCPKYYAIEADVFALPDDLDFSEMLRNGVGRYVPLTREPEKHAEQLKNAEFTFSKIDKDPAAVIEDVFTRYNENRNNCGGNIKEFFGDIEYYIGKPKKLFEVEEKSGVLAHHYTGIVIEAFLVEYEKYAVLIVFGSDE
ncbi:MAG: hypothetical protein K2N56_04885 [Oscillospiraceae bacterium]|nr:hypothetical protein [Oscillospiraceae bacterium]